jgi:hypothetical protein
MVSPGLFVNESELWQKFAVKIFGRFDICHSQIDMIEATRFHSPILNRIAAHFNSVRCSLMSADHSISRQATRGEKRQTQKVGRVTPCAPWSIANKRRAEDCPPYRNDDLFSDKARQYRS